MTRMSVARAHVLACLSEFTEPVTIATVSAASGLHGNTVRDHLDGLVEDGLVGRSTAPARGRGRPALQYVARPAEVSRPQLREYAALAMALAGHLHRSKADSRAEATMAGMHWGEELAAAELNDARAAPNDARAAPSGVPSGALSAAPSGAEADRSGAAAPGVHLPDPDQADLAATAAKHTVRLLDDLGFAPEQSPDGLVRLRTCPLLEAARRYSDVVCSVHRGLVLGVFFAHGVADPSPELRPFAEVGACVLQLMG